MSQPEPLRKGYERYQAKRQAEAIARVKAYQAWCRAGAKVGQIPPVPRDSEFRLARRMRL